MDANGRELRKSKRATGNAGDRVGLAYAKWRNCGDLLSVGLRDLARVCKTDPLTTDFADYTDQEIFFRACTVCCSLPEASKTDLISVRTRRCQGYAGQAKGISCPRKVVELFIGVHSCSLVFMTLPASCDAVRTS